MLSCFHLDFSSPPGISHGLLPSESLHELTRMALHALSSQEVDAVQKACPGDQSTADFIEAFCSSKSSMGRHQVRISPLQSSAGLLCGTCPTTKQQDDDMRYCNKNGFFSKFQIRIATRWAKDVLLYPLVPRYSAYPVRQRHRRIHGASRRGHRSGHGKWVKSWFL